MAQAHQPLPGRRRRQGQPGRGQVDDDEREVQQGFECGVLLDDFNDVKEGDEIEVFELKEVARTAQAATAPPAPVTPTPATDAE